MNVLLSIRYATFKPIQDFCQLCYKVSISSVDGISTVSNPFEKSIKTPRVNCSFTKESLDSI